MRMLALLLASSSIALAGCADDRGSYRSTSQTSTTTATAGDTAGSSRMVTGRSTGNVSDSGTVSGIGAAGTSGGAVPPGGLASAAVLSTPQDVQMVQNRLRQLNHFGGEINGLWNADTEMALRGFQRANGLPAGRLDEQALNAMGLSAASRGDGRLANISYMREPRVVQQPAHPPMQMSESDRMAHMRQMHEQMHREMDQRQGMSGVAPSAGPGAAAAMTGRGLDAQSVRQVQQKLASEGYYKIPVDGIWGPRSQDALLQFQEQRNLPVTGRLNERTVSEMGLDSGSLKTRSGQSL